MPNQPIVPNYVPGVGNLVTNRSDFESHVIGTGFRHDATMIDMNPVITIAGQQPSTVQQALTLITANLAPPIPQATIGTATSNLGTITLGGDLAGTALNPKVIRLQGIPVLTTGPSTGQALVFNGSQWGPASFTLAGDVAGATGSNKVTSITYSSTVSITSTLGLQPGANLTALSNSSITMANGSTLNLNPGSIVSGNLTFDGTVSTAEIVQQSPTSDVAPGNMLIQAADAWASASINPNGGNIVIATGNKTTGGGPGTLTLQQGHDSTIKTVLTADIQNNTNLYAGGSIFVGLNNSTSAVTVFPQTDGYCALEVFSYSGGANTQTQVNQIIPVVCRTTGSATTQAYSGITVANNSSVFIEIVWVLRNLVGTETLAQRGSIVAFASNTGAITFSNSGSVDIVYTHSGGSSSNIVVTSSGNNNVTISFRNPLINTVDWSAMIYTTYN